MSPRGLLSMLGAVAAVVLAGRHLVADGVPVGEAWLLATLVIGGFLLVVVAPLMEAGAKRDDARAADQREAARTVGLHDLARQWRRSAEALRAEVADGVALRQAPESKLARVEVLESCADAVLRVLRETAFDPEAEFDPEAGAAP